MKNKYLIIFIVLVIAGCVKIKQNEEKNDFMLSKEAENLIFIEEAKNIFGEKYLENGRSFSSYSSYKVLYNIKDKNMSLEQFFNKGQLIKNNGWIFLEKLGNSYIYCRKKAQLEVSVPKTIAKNSKLWKGNIIVQSEDEWTILFNKPKTTSTSICEDQVALN